jgi:hypothetical protein
MSGLQCIKIVSSIRKVSQYLNYIRYTFFSNRYQKLILVPRGVITAIADIIHVKHIIRSIHLTHIIYANYGIE